MVGRQVRLTEVGAVPEAKIAGRGMKRLGGKDRWETAQQVGSAASIAAGGTPAEAPDTGTADGASSGSFMRIPQNTKECTRRAVRRTVETLQSVPVRRDLRWVS